MAGDGHVVAIFQENGKKQKKVDKKLGNRREMENDQSTQTRSKENWPEIKCSVNGKKKEEEPHVT